MTSPLAIHVLSLDTIGGVESLYVHFLEQALAHKTSIHYTSVSGRHPHKNFIPLFEKLRHKPFLEQYIMGIRIPRFLRALVQLRREMVHGIVQPTSWVFWNRIEEQLPPGPSIYYEHGAAWNVQVTKKRKEFIKQSSKIIANSQAASIILREKWDIDGDITIIKNPLRPDIEVKNEARTLQKDRPLRLGFCGRLIPVKGLFVALHSTKALVDSGIHVSLDIAGVGKDKDLIIKRVKELGIEKQVHFHGTLQKISDFYDQIDILLVPSLREPLGLVALEAASRGVVCVCSAVDGLPEAVLHNQTGICIPPTISIDNDPDLVSCQEQLPEVVVNPRTQLLEPPTICDPTDFASAIKNLIENPSFYAEMSQNSLVHAQKHADFSGYFQSIIRILEEESSKHADLENQEES